mmetsp:Transcript_8009/g.18285  ORF Transcript_8009/g.18285 Transcript_8009/m.18285 type:complete len:85 (+) Transcript_8009:178-432(+)
MRPGACSAWRSVGQRHRTVYITEQAAQEEALTTTTVPATYRPRIVLNRNGREAEGVCRDPAEAAAEDRSNGRAEPDEDACEEDQ